MAEKPRPVDWVIVATYVLPTVLGWALVARLIALAHDAFFWGVH